MCLPARISVHRQRTAETVYLSSTSHMFFVRVRDLATVEPTSVDARGPQREARRRGGLARSVIRRGGRKPRRRRSVGPSLALDAAVLRLPHTLRTTRAVRPAEAVDRSVRHMHLCRVRRVRDLPQDVRDLPRGASERLLALRRPRPGCRRARGGSWCRLPLLLRRCHPAQRAPAGRRGGLYCGLRRCRRSRGRARGQLALARALPLVTTPLLHDRVRRCRRRQWRRARARARARLVGQHGWRSLVG